MFLYSITYHSNISDVSEKSFKATFLHNCLSSKKFMKGLCIEQSVLISLIDIGMCLVSPLIKDGAVYNH